MSGIIGSKINIRGSGRIAKLGTDGQVLTSGGAGVTANYEDVAGGISWQAVETGSTMTAVAGEGYWVNTTSNACTITLPASASVGDTIIFADYDRTWGTNGIELDSNGLNYQGDDDSSTVEYGTDGMALSITYMDATQGWVPTFDNAVADVPAAPSSNQNGLFGFGSTGSDTGVTNIVSNVGVVASDVAGVGTARPDLAACGYGNDKAIFGFGITGESSVTGITNLVNNSGVVASDTSGVGTARKLPAAATYGGDKGIFGFGNTGSYVSMTNLVSNSGVVASDVTGVGTARAYLAACSYGVDKDTAIFAYGHDTSSVVSMSNLVNNSGVVASDVTGVGTARRKLAACEYGGDKGIFGYGNGMSSVTNLVSNVGVIGTDVSGVGTAREELAACDYGLDKGIFGYGTTGSRVSMTNLVSNAGVVAADVTGVGTARNRLAGTNFN
jgi:hypothetical protein